MLLGVKLVLKISGWIKRRFSKVRIRIRRRNRFLGFLSVFFWFILLLLLTPTFITVGSPFLLFIFTVIFLEGIWVGCASIVEAFGLGDGIKPPKKRAKKGPAKKKKRGGRKTRKGSRA